MRKIGIEDIDDIALGSSLLGSGGGGDPYMGRLEAIAAIKEHGPVTLLDVDEVPDEWTVAPICGVGAPSVSLEKGTNGIEYPKVRAMMERMLGKKLDAFLLSEAGGMNSMVPISAAARAGMPLINADGMGRAFPGIQQDTFSLNGVSTNPFVIADEKGNCTVLYTINNDWTEEIGREITSASGGQVTTLASPMTGKKMKTSVVVGTVDYAQKLGRIIRTASNQDNPEEYFLRESGAYRFFKGKIADVLRETREGFNFGKAVLEGIGEDKGSQAVVEFQNENIYAEVDGVIAATVPDLICMVDSATFVPVTTENLKYGKRVLVVALPCDPAWRTPGGLELAGPRWFGLDVDYRPLEECYAEHMARKAAAGEAAEKKEA